MRLICMVLSIVNGVQLARALLSAPRLLGSTSSSSRINRASGSFLFRRTMVSHANGANGEYPIDMTEDERYLFDLNGYIIVRGVLSPEEVEDANAIIDKHAGEMIQRSDGALRNAVKGTKMYGTGPGRKDLGKSLEWGADSKVFKSILAHPRLVPLFHGILGKGYRMDHLPMVIAQDKGAEGFQLHGGTIDCQSGEYNPFLAYTCNHGMIRSALMGCNVMLTDHNHGDGGFCVVPGSHKSNFKMPKGMMDGQSYAEFIQQPATKAGDVVLFSEGTVHGAQPWTPENRQRRVCLYRFTPATNVYGRSYFGHEGGGWPKEMYEDLTDAQRAVLEPPYANRLDRPSILPDGSTEITTRNDRKKQHDREVFGTKYF
jgi:ectoine hydroxylase-related dioxygenase (phytanoyl-CoA dioxygenase family)